jgi:hypothetical protein
VDGDKGKIIALLEAGIPGFVQLLVNHRPPRLHERSLLEVMKVDARQPARLTSYFDAWSKSHQRMYQAPPSLVFAVIGQARADGRLSPETEGDLLARLLTHWALRSTLDTSALCATLPQVRQQALLT